MNFNRRLLETEQSMPPINGNQTDDPYVNASTFDINMIIILAALLCALLSALTLNSIIRCFFKRRVINEAGANQATNKGIKKKTLRQIPIVVYGRADTFRANECSICLGEFVDGEKIRVLPKCKHGFHVTCIDKWLLSHSSCPNCRHSLNELTSQRASREVAISGL